MRRKGFSFACPCLECNGEDKAFRRFLKTAETDPDKIHNPFPQIAYSDNFNEACTHPLLYLWYLPTIDPSQHQDPVKFVQTTFYDYLTLTHEFRHLALADTPAKMFAQHISAWLYSHLIFLLIEESWNEVIWDEIVKLNTKLTEICEATTLTEELLALSLSIEDVTNCHREYQEEFVELAQLELEILEEKSVNEYQKTLSSA
jgi:hypothetical protein